jgi:acyl-CoA synthetase (AMP-forming)/AMP-acid ligase II
VNIKQMLEKTVREVPQKEAIVFGSRRVSYRELEGGEVIQQHYFSSLWGAAGGGMALPAEISKKFQDTLGVNLMEGYGVTEVPPIIMVHPYDKPKQGERVTAEELRAFCRQRLADFKVPRKIILDSNLAKTASGKVDRARLKELASQK